MLVVLPPKVFRQSCMPLSYGVLFYSLRTIWVLLTYIFLKLSMLNFYHGTIATTRTVGMAHICLPYLQAVQLHPTLRLAFLASHIGREEVVLGRVVLAFIRDATPWLLNEKPNATNWGFGLAMALTPGTPWPTLSRVEALRRLRGTPPLEALRRIG